MTHLPATHALLGPSAGAVLACDVGGTDIKIALVDAEGSVIGLRRAKSRLNGQYRASDISRLVGMLATDLRAEHPDVVPLSAGVSVPGIVDESAGVCVYSRNLEWRDEPVRDLMERSLGLPVSLGHDVRSAGLAELTIGAGAGFRNAVVIVVGTGVASAIMVDGHPLVSGGYAGELGQTPISLEDGALPLEDVASAAAIARRYSARAGTNVAGSREVVELKLAGDLDAHYVWLEAIDALAHSIVQCASIIAPEIVVIGGGLALAGNELLIPLRTRVEGLLTTQRSPRIVLARFGGEAGLYGAAIGARELNVIALGSASPIDRSAP